MLPEIAGQNNLEAAVFKNTRVGGLSEGGKP